MGFAEFQPLNNQNKQTPTIIDVPKIPQTFTPSPTSIQVYYPAKNKTFQTEDEELSFSFFGWFVIAWIIAGFIAFITSLFCFAKSGSVLEKIIGSLLSIILGPFYWIYYFASSSYCK